MLVCINVAGAQVAFDGENNGSGAPVVFEVHAYAGAGGAISPSGLINDIAAGSSIEFTATPTDSTFMVNGWLLNGKPVQSGGTTYQLSNIESNCLVQVSFVPVPFYVYASSGPGGTISPSGLTAGIPAGSSLTFTATPTDTTLIVGQWYLDLNTDLRAAVGITPTPVQSGGSTYTLTNIQSNHRVYVTFAPSSYVVESSAGLNGSISPSGKTVCAAGSNLTFTATPKDSTFTVGLWYLDDNTPIQDGGTTLTLSNIQSNHKVYVTFAPASFTVGSSAGPGGTIDPSGLTKCVAGSSLTFTATPTNSTFTVGRWYLDDNTPVQEGGTTYTLSNIQANHRVYVTFVPTTYTVGAGAGPGGTIDPNGLMKCVAGSSVTFTATPSDGSFAVGSWRVDQQVVQTGGTTYTLSNIQANHVVSVGFESKGIRVTSSAGPGGKINPNGLSVVAPGSSLTFTAVPATDGFVVSQWFVDTTAKPAQSGGTTFTLSNIQSGHTVLVTFTPKHK
jgi:hypothetical protein